VKALRKTLDKMRPNFEKGGRFAKLHSLYDAIETFLFLPSETSGSGVHIHDAANSKRSMSIVLLALFPALLFGIYNIGYQHYLAIGQPAELWNCLLFGLLALLPKIIVSYAVGLGIEIIVAQIKGHEVQEGFFVSGMLIPMIIPIDTPLWMLGVATAFSVIFAKEVFGGTGYNIFNVALITRAFLFFAYPSKMSGDQVFVRVEDSFGFGAPEVVNDLTQTIDGYSGATPLGQIEAMGSGTNFFHGIDGHILSWWDMFVGLIPGSVGETSTLAILLGAALLIITGIGSWKIITSVFTGGFLMAAFIYLLGGSSAMQTSPIDHLLLGGFAFGAVFMATDPVTAARTETGKWVYGFLIGVICILIRVFNPGYPEGMMLAILFMNAFAPLIDYFVVDKNIKQRLKRTTIKQ
jgi:Na+-transporting NADH:ubiquinone oxidoreductase subunit B